MTSRDGGRTEQQHADLSPYSWPQGLGPTGAKPGTDALTGIESKRDASREPLPA